MSGPPTSIATLGSLQARRNNASALPVDHELIVVLADRRETTVPTAIEGG
jgi:hypothetical protein